MTPELVNEASRHPTRMGHMTEKIQKGFVEWQAKSGRESIDDNALGLEAPESDDDRLYFWQIFNLVGRNPLRELSKVFYTNVFNDEDEWFWSSFGKPDINNHAMFLGLALIDCFGGGSMYAGGQLRLDDVHKTAAPHVMTQEAAIKWATHMRNAMDTMQQDFDNIDKRIRPALNEYFMFFMARYSQMFGFSLDGVQFETINCK